MTDQRWRGCRPQLAGHTPLLLPPSFPDQVRRLLRLLKELQLATGMQAMEEALAIARQQGSSVAGTGLLPLG